jgi:hypothetical protein
VASVQGTPISRDALNHWVGIKRAEAQSSSTPTSASDVELRKKALAFLITAHWLEREAAAQGLSVSTSEVNATYQRLLNGSTGQAFAASLARRGISSADELMLLRLGALAQKLRLKIALSEPGVSQGQIKQRIGAFIAAYRQRWKQRTVCQPGYLIAECRNGPALPRLSGSGP